MKRINCVRSWDGIAYLRYPANLVLNQLETNTEYMHNKKVLNLAKFTDQDYNLYGWKHKGNIALYLATKDIILVQAQKRHKNMGTTDA